MAAVSIRTVADDDLPQLVRVMASAFAADPCFSWVFRDEERRHDDLALLFETACAVLVPHGLSVTTSDRAAVALWAPPGAADAPDEVIAPYSARMGERYAADSLGRLLQFFALTRENHPVEPHYYLGVLASDVGRQGRGLGSACMAQVLERVDAAGEAAYLESSNEKNVPLYERHGFNVISTVDLPDGGPPIFFMWRAPAR